MKANSRSFVSIAVTAQEIGPGFEVAGRIRHKSHVILPLLCLPPSHGGYTYVHYCSIRSKYFLFLEKIIEYDTINYTLVMNAARFEEESIASEKLSRRTCGKKRDFLPQIPLVLQHATFHFPSLQETEREPESKRPTKYLLIKFRSTF